MTMATHVAVMNGGSVEQFGSPQELVSEPSSAFVATFVGTPPANLVDAGLIPAAHPLGRKGHSGRFMFRPEDILVSRHPDPASIEMDFAEISPLAGRSMITGTRNGLRLTAVADGSFRFTIGDKVHFLLPPAAAACFDSKGKRA